jgi:hypothetical protein
MLRRAFDWAFRSREDGRVVIAQTPNLPLAIWLATVVLGLVDEGAWIRAVGRVALVWWALDEIVRGVNPWRRCLGAVVLVGIVWAVV